MPGAETLTFDVHAFSAGRALLLALGKGERARIYRTTDAGEHWTMVFHNQDPNAFYDCLDVRGDVGVALSDPVGGAFVMQRTTDGGVTWKSYAPPGYEQLHAVEGE